MKLVYKATAETNVQRPIYLICVFRDERILLEYFIKYYHSLGITHFVMIDNQSRDGSSEYLKSLLDINLLLYEAYDSYRSADYGTKWVNWVLHEHCKNQYCLVVDVDELFSCDWRKYGSLLGLIECMEEGGANVAPAFLLDMYPEQINDGYRSGDNFIEHSPYFDRCGSPYYEKAGTIYGDFNHLIGGVRKRVLNATVCIHKFPFFRFDFLPLSIAPGCHYFKKVRTIIGESARINLFGENAVLLHFKFIKPGFERFIEMRISNNEDWADSEEYRAYQSVVARNGAVRFYDEKITRRFLDVSSIDDFFKVPHGFASVEG